MTRPASTDHVLSPEEAAVVKAMRDGRRKGATPIDLLCNGEVLFSTNASARSSRYGYLRKRGYRLMTRAGERDGEQGFFMWAEPLEGER